MLATALASLASLAVTFAVTFAVTLAVSFTTLATCHVLAMSLAALATLTGLATLTALALAAHCGSIGGRHQPSCSILNTFYSTRNCILGSLYNFSGSVLHTLEKSIFLLICVGECRCGIRTTKQPI